MQVAVTYRITRNLEEDNASAEDMCLSSEERARCGELMSPSDRRDFVAAHVLLRYALSSVQPRDPATWMFVRGPSGKPRLADADPSHGQLAFNLSHTRGLVACIVAPGGDVGIDVERVHESTDMLDVARHHFSPSECAELESCHPSARAARFADIWTLKEAYAKAIGIGIADGLREPAFAFGGQGSLHVSARAADADWTFAGFGILDYRLAVAVRNTSPDAPTIRFSESGHERPGQSRARLLWISSAMTVALSGAIATGSS